MLTKTVISAAIGAVVVLSAAALADATDEIAIAANHIGYAAASKNTEAVHMHLHHAVNCLEGSNGPDFDSAMENPCAKAGNGAIPDTADEATKAKLQAVVATAKRGIASNDEGVAKKAATDAYSALKAINPNPPPYELDLERPR